MSEEIESTPPRSQLREEAAHWFALMRGPQAREHQEDFNRWLARGALHRRAFNSVSETFNLGKALRGETIPRPADLSLCASQSAHVPLKENRVSDAVIACGVGVLAVTLALTGSLYAWFHRNPLPPVINGADQEARYITQIGEIRNFVLIDGSKLTLDTNTLVLASYTPHERALRLVNGRARFYARREGRPFIVRADTTLIRAGDTPFDVSLSDNRRVAVRPVGGMVEVQAPRDTAVTGSTAEQGSMSPPIRVASRQNLVAAPGTGNPALAPAADEGQWPEGVEAFNNISLAELIERANRYAREPIVLSGNEIGTLRISGTFRFRDTAQVADKIAALLNLTVTASNGKFVLERPCGPDRLKPCRRQRQ